MEADQSGPELSRSALADALATVELRPGDEGLGVARLQRALIALSYLSDEQIQSGPGIFGPKTAAAVRALQNEWDVPASGALCPATRQALVSALSGAPPPGGWGGHRPAPGTTDVRQWVPVTAPTLGDPKRRSARRYAQVIDQFAVEVNPRYAPRHGNTYEHIFAWDVTGAMGVEVPHWVDDAGAPAAPGKGRELVASDVERWLLEHGPRFGWREVREHEARQLATVGHPVVATGRDREGGPRIGIVRPAIGEEETVVAAAGTLRTRRAPAKTVLGGGERFWVHDQGTIARTLTGDLSPPDLKTGHRELGRGDQGQDVVWLQEALVTLGDLTRTDMSTGPGAYGPRTEAAVKAIQLRTGVPTTGHFGPLTRSAVYASLRQPSFAPGWLPEVVLERGIAGRHVWALQNVLLKLELLDWDAFVSAPGEFGPRTEAAVRSLQLRWGLLPTGVFGPATRDALRRELAGLAPPAPAEPEPILGAERAVAFALNPPPGEGPNGGSWHGAPLALVREAYRTSMKIKGPLSQATPMAVLEAFRAHKRLGAGAVPPRGALVFFSWGAEGAVAISLGDGRCVGTRTRGPQTEVRSCFARTFLGWAAP